MDGGSAENAGAVFGEQATAKRSFLEMPILAIAISE
jgi:hypothetical protein